MAEGKKSPSLQMISDTSCIEFLRFHEEGNSSISLIERDRSIVISEKLLSFYKEIIDAQYFLFHICLLYTNIIIKIERNGSYLIR